MFKLVEGGVSHRLTLISQNTSVPSSHPSHAWEPICARCYLMQGGTHVIGKKNSAQTSSRYTAGRGLMGNSYVYHTPVFTDDTVTDSNTGRAHGNVYELLSGTK